MFAIRRLSRSLWIQKKSLNKNLIFYNIENRSIRSCYHTFNLMRSNNNNEDREVNQDDYDDYDEDYDEGNDNSPFWILTAILGLCGGLYWAKGKYYWIQEEVDEPEKEIVQHFLGPPTLVDKKIPRTIVIDPLALVGTDMLLQDYRIYGFNYPFYICTQFRKRPLTDIFITRLKQLGWEIVMWSHMEHTISDGLTLDILNDDVMGVPQFNIHHCNLQGSWRGRWVKDLSKLNRDFKRLLCCDTEKGSYEFHPNNGLLVPKYNGEETDWRLAKALMIIELISLVDPSDIRPILKKLDTQPNASLPEIFGINKEELTKRCQLSWSTQKTSPKNSKNRVVYWPETGPPTHEKLPSNQTVVSPLPDALWLPFRRQKNMKSSSKETTYYDVHQDVNYGVKLDSSNTEHGEIMAVKPWFEDAMEVFSLVSNEKAHN